MSGPTELAITAGVLVDVGLKANLVLGLGWGLTRLVRPAAARHGIWATSLLSLPVLGALSASRGAAVALDLPWLVATWAVGVVVALVPVVLGLVRLERLRRSSRIDPSLSDVRWSEHVTGPLTWGWIRPVVVMPEAARTWSRPTFDAALAHERAHVTRRDWLVHLLTWLVCVLFWFDPLVWLARRAMMRDAEHAADDAVLRQGVVPSTYASLLLSLARSPAPTGALGASSEVGRRVHAVLGEGSRSGRRWPALVGVALGFVLFAPSLAGVPLWADLPEAELTCSPGPMP